jgi:hypothetical protein
MSETLFSSQQFLKKPQNRNGRGNKSKFRRASVRYVINGAGARATLKIASNSGQELLEKELRNLQRRVGIGYELEVKWLPGQPEYHDERKLAEEVRGNTIMIYTDNPRKAVELLRHGFLEWLMNRHTKPYRQMINKLIALFEDLQYENKEKTIEILEKLL